MVAVVALAINCRQLLSLQLLIPIIPNNETVHVLGLRSDDWEVDHLFCLYGTPVDINADLKKNLIYTSVKNFQIFKYLTKTYF